MASPFEVHDVDAINRDLTIQIGHGTGSMFETDRPDTYFYVRPPLTEDEHQTLIDGLNPEGGPMGELLMSGVEESTEWVRFRADGAPSEEHLELGIRLAKDIIKLKGLRAGQVVASIGEEACTRLVRAKSEAELAGEDMTVIDADEFAEAQRDPKVREMLRRAREISNEREQEEAAEKDPLDELSPDQRESAIFIRSAMAKKFKREKSDFSILKTTNEQGEPVFAVGLTSTEPIDLLGFPPELISVRRTWDSTMEDYASDRFMVRVDGEMLDTREAVTLQMLGAIASINTDIKYETVWLTGEPNKAQKGNISEGYTAPVAYLENGQVHEDHIPAHQDGAEIVFRPIVLI